MECIPVEPSAPNKIFEYSFQKGFPKKDYPPIHILTPSPYFLYVNSTFLVACNGLTLSCIKYKLNSNKWYHLQTFVDPKFERPISAIMAASPSFVLSTASPSSFGRSGASGSKFGRDCEDEAFGGS
jgi:hypothetical protein